MIFCCTFDQECLIWVFLGKNFTKTIVRFEISTLEFVQLQNLAEKPYVGTFFYKKCLILVFTRKNFKKILLYLKSAPSTSSKYKILQKMLEFAIKYPLFGYFRARFSENNSHIWNQHLLITKCCEETKMSKFGTKIAILWYFSPRMSYLGIFG